MTEFHSPTGVLPFIPDDLSIPQFILDSQHPTRPLRNDGTPWLIGDDCGREIGLEELRARTFGLANSLKSKWSIGERDQIFFETLILLCFRRR